MRNKSIVVAFCLCIVELFLPMANVNARIGAQNTWPPQEVKDFVENHYNTYTIEDYIQINDTPKGSYVFVMVSNESNRILLGFEKKGEVFSYWLKNAGAVPQGEGYVFFQQHVNGQYVCQGNTNRTYTDTLGFDIVRIDKHKEEYWSQFISYHWENAGFKLMAYMNRDKWYGQVYVTNDGLKFYDISNDKAIGQVNGVVQRDIRYVIFSNLPDTINTAKRSLSLAPDIPTGELVAQRIRFTGGEKYPVYSGPGINYLRGADGKAIVSTNDWIQVFGREGDWILIQYAIDSQHMRFGYIDVKSLPKNAKIQNLMTNYQSYFIAQAAPLTDDPLLSQRTLAFLQQGNSISLLSVMGEWAYIETMVNNTPVRGFVLLKSIQLQ